MNQFIYRIEASQAQDLPEGQLLGRMYYGGFLDAVLNRDQRSGYPHNGGEHTLSLKLSLPDLKAFLEIVAEFYKDHEGAVPFVNSLKERFSKSYPRLSTAL